MLVLALRPANEKKKLLLTTWIPGGTPGIQAIKMGNPKDLTFWCENQHFPLQIYG